MFKRSLRSHLVWLLVILTALSASDALAKATKPVQKHREGGQGDRQAPHGQLREADARHRQNPPGATVIHEEAAPTESGGKFKGEYRRLKTFAAELSRGPSTDAAR